MPQEPAFVERHRPAIVGLFVLALLAQTIALYTPGAHGPSTGVPLDKVAHFTMFAVVAALGAWARVPVGWLVAGLLAQAVVSEFVQQSLLPDRGGEVGDVVADALGIAAGVLIARTWPRIRPSPPTTRPDAP